VFTPQQQIPNLQTPAKEATSHFAQVLSQKQQSNPAATPAAGTLNYQPSVR
jgi:hypothetical protein